VVRTRLHHGRDRLIIYTIPYAFIVILITMGRYRPEQTEAARSLRRRWLAGVLGYRIPADQSRRLLRLRVHGHSHLQRIRPHQPAERRVRHLHHRADQPDAEHRHVRTVLCDVEPRQLCCHLTIIGIIIIYTMIRRTALARERQRAKAEPVMSTHERGPQRLQDPADRQIRTAVEVRGLGKSYGPVGHLRDVT
jgi:spermidine/putrescine transport system permease protein